MPIPLDELDEIEREYRKEWVEAVPCDVTITLHARMTSVGSKTFVFDVPAFYGGYETIMPAQNSIEEIKPA